MTQHYWRVTEDKIDEIVAEIFPEILAQLEYMLLIEAEKGLGDIYGKEKDLRD